MCLRWVVGEGNAVKHHSKHRSRASLGENHILRRYLTYCVFIFCCIMSLIDVSYSKADIYHGTECLPYDDFDPMIFTWCFQSNVIVKPVILWCFLSFCIPPWQHYTYDVPERSLSFEPAKSVDAYLMVSWSRFTISSSCDVISGQCTGPEAWGVGSETSRSLLVVDVEFRAFGVRFSILFSGDDWRFPFTLMLKNACMAFDSINYDHIYIRF